MDKLFMPMVLWLLFVGVMLYFCVFIPGKKKNKEVRKIHDSVAVGDEVITISGVIGIVKERDEESVLIQIDPNGTCIKTLIYAIQTIKTKCAS